MDVERSLVGGGFSRMGRHSFLGTEARCWLLMVDTSLESSSREVAHGIIGAARAANMASCLLWAARNLVAGPEIILPGDGSAAEEGDSKLIKWSRASGS